MAKCKSDLSIPLTPGASISSQRNKVSLKPGRSLMDWIRFTNSGKDLTGTGGRVLEVSSRELSKHNTKQDAWIALQGKVYNITHYLEYHPGGEDELMRGAGKDATDLFNQVHRWVNYDSMLQKCFVGILKKSWSLDVTKIPAMMHLKSKQSKKFLTPSDDTSKIAETKTLTNGKTEMKKSKSAIDISIRHTESQENVDVPILTPVSKWPLQKCQDNGNVRLHFNNDSESAKLTISFPDIVLFGVIIQMCDQKMYIKLHDIPSVISICLPQLFEKDYKVLVLDGISLELSLTKLMKENDLSDKSINVKPETDAEFYQLTDVIYWSCKLIKKVQINHNSYLFTFALPHGTKMWVPIGRHVQFKTHVEGMEIIRSYTPVLPLSTIETVGSANYDGSDLHFMIKVYPVGIMSQKINKCKIGDHMLISSYTGTFSKTFFETCDSAILLAAGTGITPMIRIINRFLQKNKPVELIFFNKTEKDILWKTELQQCSSSFTNFTVIDVLSEPSEKWNGYSSQLDTDFLKKISARNSGLKLKFLVCGPIPFSDAALKCFKEVGYAAENFYIFSGS